MAGDFDGFAVLAAIVAKPTLFESGRADAAKAARAIAVKQIKTRGLPLDLIRQICGALGTNAYGMILDGMKGGEIKTLAKRLDAHNAELKSMSETDARRHLLALSGSLAPVERAQPGRKSGSASRVAKASGSQAKTASPKTPVRDEPAGGRTLTSQAMSARSPRRKGSET